MRWRFRRNDNTAYGLLRVLCRVAVLALSILIILSGGTAAADTAYLESLLTRARVEGVSRERQWRLLLHCKSTDGDSPASLIDDPRFFLAPDGKSDPAAELEATLRGLLRDDVTGDDAVACRFPARTAWLRERLGIEPGRRPKVSCRQLDDALAAADPKRAVVVFPSAHINSPASMFGHTFLRIDNSYQSELLAYSVNYAAVTTETNGAVYAFKGIFGLYPGRYSVSPYYEKVKEYNDIEQRDIWEYRLTLTEEETRRLVLHVWELQGTASDYFFFDENCSFSILSLLEAARPSSRLTDRLPLWVIPSDTVRVIRREGLVSSVKYRPSLGTRIRHLAALLDREGRQTAWEIAEGGTPPDAARQVSPVAPVQGRTLELAAEFLQYRYARQELTREVYTRRYHAVLQERSRLGAQAGTAPPVPEPVAPDEGHGTARGGVAVGSWQGRLFTELAGRFAYHDIMDPDEGYVRGAQINFFDAALRIYPGDGRTRLQRLHVIDILSLSPRDRFFAPFSWKVNTGLDQEVMSDGTEHPVYRLTTGGGLAWESAVPGVLFLMAETDLKVAGSLSGNGAIGCGGSAGAVGNITDSWKAGLTLTAVYYPVLAEHSRLQAVLAQTVRVSRNNSISLNLKGERTFWYDRYEVKAGWNLYF